MDPQNILSQPVLPPDDLARALVLSRADGAERPHIGMVGDTYTILLTGAETGGRYCLFDMHIPAGGGPGPHRHDFEETFTLLEGELDFTFRAKKSTASAGQTVHVPANAPHQFHNSSSKPVRLLCLCAPAGQDDFFLQLGVPVATRTTPPPTPSPDEMEAFKKKAGELAPKYQTELLKEA